MQDVALDACCVINLCAGQILPVPQARSGQGASASFTGAASQSFNFKLHVPGKVAEESLYILQPDTEDEAKLVKVKLDLGAYITAGTFHSCDLQGEDETRSFVQLATYLDDGEAVCFAIAQNRGWAMATDDRIAARLAAQAEVAVITTPELIKHWADKAGASDVETGEVLKRIETFAHFFPRKTAPLYSWWTRLLSKAKS